MKILFINQSLGIGGAETFNSQLLNWLGNKHEIKAYVTNLRFAKMLNTKPRIISVILDIIGDWKGLLKAFFLWPFALVIYFKIIWDNKDADVIFMTGFIEKIIVTPIAKFLKLKVVWVEFAPLQTILAKFWGLPKFFYDLSRPNHVIVPTQNTLRKNNMNAIVIPCGLDIDIKKYAKIKIERFSVCCVSRIEKGKGQDTLLEAWPRVLKKYPQAILYIVGEGDTLPKTTNVVLTGRVPDALEYIAKSEIFVFPSRWPLEGFGLSMIEAMALAKPVIAYDQGPVPEIVDGSTGILVKDDIATAIIKLISDAKLSKQLGLAGQKKYLENFTLAKIGPQYEKVFAN